MPTRNVVLSDHQQQLIEALVTSGRYQNASEILRDGLRMVERREAEDAARLAALRAAVQVGLDDLDAGRYRDIRDSDLTDYIAALGVRAEEASRTAG